MGTPEPWGQHLGPLDLWRGWESTEHWRHTGLDVQGKPGPWGLGLVLH